MFHNTTFNEVIKFLPRLEIKKLVSAHNSDRYSKRFKSWDHLLAMLSLQLSSSNSLRDLELLSGNSSFNHYHLNISGVKRSTFSDANQKRSCDLFRDIAVMMLGLDSQRQSELGELITLIDSSPIALNSGRGHDWAHASTTRHNNGGLKLHVQYCPEEEQIEYAAITDTNVNDITEAQDLEIHANRVYVFDKGYCDYSWWHKITQRGSTFVTRLKVNAAYDVIEERAIDEEERGFILKDQIITLSNRNPRGRATNPLHTTPLRLVEVVHPTQKGKSLRIVSNAIEGPVRVVAGWYKQRWAIELLFKWLKQRLKIKRFIGESKNAISIQIYTAIIAYVLLKLYRKASQYSHLRMKDLLIIIQNNLVCRPQLMYEAIRRQRSKQLEKKQKSFLGGLK